MRSFGLITVIFSFAGLFGAAAIAAESIGEPGRGSSEPNPLNNVYFGEEHLHTTASPDAFAFGTRNTADEAYRYAKGEAIKHDLSGKMIQKQTPYDFAAVTDHAEYLGMMPLLLDPNSPLQKTEIGKMIASGEHSQGEAAFQQIITSATINKPIPYLVDPKVMKTAWQKQVDAANKHYEPGKFTTLIAFEWSSQPNSKNLHHNVFFRDDTGPERVFSAFDSVHREDLWTYQEYQRSVGHENFSIPHNSNVSNSAMFALHTSNGNPIDKRWAERSARNSPAVEIVQTKGASETHPALSPNDEFAGFEEQVHPPAGLRRRAGSDRQELRAQRADRRGWFPGDDRRQPVQVWHRRRQRLHIRRFGQRRVQLPRCARQHRLHAGDPPERRRFSGG